jgi:hypothetical protein
MEALYVGLAAVLVAGLWVVAKSGNPAALLRGSFGEALKAPAPTRREELLKARAQIKRQLEIQPVRNRMDDRAVKDELRNILAEIDAELAETPPDHHNRHGLKS